VISGGADGAVWLWDTGAAADPGRELGRHEGDVFAVAATGDNKVVSVGSDGAVRLWDPDDADDPGRVLGRHHGGV